ncbi:unnamed protein product [Cyprideis torosa]|uniref:Uncharacterized protein n=1 Tax=Cyprideis torosa TaxID=163714 RepID=A0A7R8WNN1_9CRUS|nr:unnamed protein product [Cyprideis torosa]CAG0900416.1 unnamed protein product [Cyprideis torosa]
MESATTFHRTAAVHRVSIVELKKLLFISCKFRILGAARIHPIQVDIDSVWLYSHGDLAARDLKDVDLMKMEAECDPTEPEAWVYRSPWG